MKLEINLADREEIAAAVPLLQVILDNTPKTCGVQCSHTVTQAVGEVSISHTVTGDPAAIAAALPANVAEVMARTQVEEGETIYSSQQSPMQTSHVSINPDPAAVFGGAPAAPLAPSIPPAPALATTAPPPPANIAPTTPMPGPASSAAVVASVELDARGLPWDSRIHSSSKGKLANGNWKNARGKAPEQVAQIEAELLATVKPTAIPSAPVAPQAPAAPSADPTTFEQLMLRITEAVAAKTMPPTAVGAACASQGIASIVTLQQSPQFVPLVWATLKQQFPGLQ